MHNLFYKSQFFTNKIIIKYSLNLFSEWCNIWPVLLHALRDLLRVFRPTKCGSSIPALDIPHLVPQVRLWRFGTLSSRIRARKTAMQCRLLPFCLPNEVFEPNEYGERKIFNSCDIFDKFTVFYKISCVFCPQYTNKMQQTKEIEGCFEILRGRETKYSGLIIRQRPLVIHTIQQCTSLLIRLAPPKTKSLYNLKLPPDIQNLLRFEEATSLLTTFVG